MTGCAARRAVLAAAGTVNRGRPMCGRPARAGQRHGCKPVIGEGVQQPTSLAGMGMGMGGWREDQQHYAYAAGI